MLGDFLLLVGLVVTVVGLALQGYIGYEGVVGLLFVLAAIVAAGRKIIVRTLAVLLSLYLFGRTYSAAVPGGPMAILLALAPLFVAVFGLYVMFRGLLKNL